MKFTDVALTVLIVLGVVIIIFLLSSKNPKQGLVAPLVVPVRTFFGYLGGHGRSTTINIVGGGSSSSSSSSSSGGNSSGEEGGSSEEGGEGSGGSGSGPILSGPIIPPSGLGPVPPVSPFTNYSAY